MRVFQIELFSLRYFNSSHHNIKISIPSPWKKNNKSIPSLCKFMPNQKMSLSNKNVTNTYRPPFSSPQIKLYIESIIILVFEMAFPQIPQHDPRIHKSN